MNTGRPRQLMNTGDGSIVRILVADDILQKYCAYYRSVIDFVRKIDLMYYSCAIDTA